METLGLEEDSLVGVPPEVCHWIAAVAPARHYLEPAVASPIRALFTLLLLASLVANVRPQVDPRASLLVDYATLRADHDAETGLFEDVDVVVVCVAHGPARGVAASLLVVGPVDAAAVAVGPLVETVPVGHLWDGVVVDVPADGVHHLMVHELGVRLAHGRLLAGRFWFGL